VNFKHQKVKKIGATSLKVGVRIIREQSKQEI